MLCHPDNFIRFNDRIRILSDNEICNLKFQCQGFNEAENHFQKITLKHAHNLLILDFVYFWLISK